MFNYYQRLIGAKDTLVAQYMYVPSLYPDDPAHYPPKIVRIADATATGELSAQPMITAVGHSLGGHLAMMLSRMTTHVSSVTTLVAPGFDSILGRVTYPLTSEGFFQLLGTATGLSSMTTGWNTPMTHLDVPGDQVHNIGNTPGISQNLFSENANQNPVSAHDKSAITDALAVYNLLSEMDPTLSLDTITNMLKASSNIAANSLETIITALGTIFEVGSAQFTGNAFDTHRDWLYQSVNDINAALRNSSNYCNAQPFSIADLSTQNAADLANLAQSDIAYRYALVNGLPFAILGANYGLLNIYGDYDLINAETGQINFSEQYLADRAAYLVAKLRDNTVDSQINNRQDIRYQDITSQTLLNPINTPQREIIFGGTGGEGFGGFAGDDHLYGGAGDDQIIGGDGQDYIEGGAGNDILTGGSETDQLIGGTGDDTLYGNDGMGGDILDGGIGFDTYYADSGDVIREGDGKGQVILNGRKLGLATRKKGEWAYKDTAGNVYYASGGGLYVNGLFIEDFHYADLGITFREDDPDNPLKKAFKKARITKSPIVLDLDGNGITTQNMATGNTFFDYDGNGFAERTGWATAGDGILVRDLNGNGTIDNGSELFGDRTLLQNGQIAGNGFIALADLDSNGDGKFDHQDTAWNDVKIWQDSNSNGITDAGELKTLTELNIQSIATAYTSSTTFDAAGNPLPDPNGNLHQQQSSFTQTDGTTHLAEDIWFNVDLSSTTQVNPLTLSTALRNMPEIQGMGNVASLRQVLEQEAQNDSIYMFVNKKYTA